MGHDRDHTKVHGIVRVGPLADGIGSEALVGDGEIVLHTPTGRIHLCRDSSGLRLSDDELEAPDPTWGIAHFIPFRQHVWTEALHAHGWTTG